MTSRSPFQHILFRDFKTKHTLVSKAFKKDPHLEALFLWIFRRSNADRNWALAIPLKSMEITAPHPFSRFWFRDFSDYHHGDSVWCKNSGVTSLTPSLPSQHTFPQSLHPTSDVLLHPTDLLANTSFYNYPWNQGTGIGEALRKAGSMF